MEYQLKSGKIVTDEDIEAIAQDIENGKLPGKGWDGKVVQVDRAFLPNRL